ncbi:MAG: argininosuccinate lyase, partial [Gemmatimonadota bacterium]|nr:argininosuccinate lyase [Gemmatimonadota bacterium]
GTIRTLELDAGACAGAVDPGMLATELADFLVRTGVPFREAHSVVGGLVREAEQRECALDMLPQKVFIAASAAFADAEMEALFSARASLERRSGVGGTSREAVNRQITALRAAI